MGIFVLIGLLVVLGYLLGIVGFFRAGVAMREARHLRALLFEEIEKRDAAGASGSAQNSAERADTIVQRDNVPTPPQVETPRDRSPPPLPAAPTPAVSAAPTHTPRDHDLESVLTMRWAVWLGAVALLLAGVFLIRYAAEQGLLGPTTRCCAAVLLGVALLVAAGWLQRRDLPPIEGPFDIDQAPGALAAGGVAILFGAAYGAGPFYELLPPLVGFAALAAVSLLALLASLRFGPLTAAVGIVGAFASPALVSTQSPSLIGLFAYLGVATAAAHAVVRRTAWTWLGWAVTIAGALWVLAAASHPLDPELWAAAAFVPLSAILGLLLPSLALDQNMGRLLAWGQFATIAVAGLCLDAWAPGVVSRAAVFALSPIAVWKAIEEPRLDRLPWLTAACGLFALWIWNGSSRPDRYLAFPFDRFDAPRDTGTALGAAFVFAMTYAVIGLRLETRSPHPPRWAALVAAVPVLTLAVCYAKIGRLQPDIRWGLSGLLLALLLTLSTYRAIAREEPPSAGVHAAGSVAALALAFAMATHDHWLTTALALMLPGLAWIESKVELPALRIVAMVVAIVTFVLLSNWLPYDLAFGHQIVTRHAFVTYAIPAAAFFLAARMFRPGGDDSLVALLEAGAIVIAALFVTLEIRLWFGNGSLDSHVGFDEFATLMLAVAAQAYAYDRIARRGARKTAVVARGIFGCLAYAMAVGLLIANPMATGATVNRLSLLLAYLIPGVLSGYVSRSASDSTIRSLLVGYAVAACVAWTTLQVRQFFHPDAMSLFVAPVTEAELWMWSGAWLLDGFAIMVWGVRSQNRRLRLVALALIGLVCLKVFLFDMAELTGLWRVASFLGLGLTLIALGAVHRRYVLPHRGRATA